VKDDEFEGDEQVQKAMNCEKRLVDAEFI